MTAVTAEQLAAMLGPAAPGTPGGPPASVTSNERGRCRGVGCSEAHNLDAFLIDDPATRSGLHVGCVEAAPLPPLVDQPALFPASTEPRCTDCEFDNHRCPGCGNPVPHGTIACVGCSTAKTVRLAPKPETAPALDGQAAAYAAPSSVFSAPAGLPPAHPLKRELMNIIRWSAANSERSLQTAIGPSEIGVDCLRRLAYKVVGTPACNTTADPWFSVVGTAVHDWLAWTINAYQLQVLGRTGENPRYLLEQRLTISTDEYGVTGSCDLYDCDLGDVVDHKIVGHDALKNYTNNGPSNQYRKQIHLYGLGHRRAGRPVRDVVIAFYPRSNYLDKMHVWSEPYDEQIALDALNRLDTVRTMTGVLPIATIPATASESGCVWCPFYRPGRPADATGCPGAQGVPR